MPIPESEVQKNFLKGGKRRDFGVLESTHGVQVRNQHQLDSRENFTDGTVEISSPRDHTRNNDRREHSSMPQTQMKTLEKEMESLIQNKDNGVSG